MYAGSLGSSPCLRRNLIATLQTAPFVGDCPGRQTRSSKRPWINTRLALTES